jgi:hypothetical protein
MKPSFFALPLLLVGLSCQAETPQQILQGYIAEASGTQAGFVPSAKRGEAFFQHSFGINDKMPACISCHTETPTGPGKHAITGKSIRPMAVSANADRFTDPAKVEKWFGRNCKEIVGRACTPAEKADFIAYLSEVR